MIKYKSGSTEKSVGFISTRLAGTDGVSLETEKWADVFREEGFTCYYFAGELDTPPEYSYLLDIAHFKHPEIKDIYEQFNLVSNYLKKIPEHINVIICAGNHDPVRIAEPQPKIPRKFLEEIINKTNDD
mgnify:CR=1 FL=1